MGYRNYFYLVDKSLVETVKEMNQSSLLSRTIITSSFYYVY